MGRQGLLAFWILVVATPAPGTAWAQQSRCADCHFANPAPTFAIGTRDWEVHLRNWTCQRTRARVSVVRTVMAAAPQRSNRWWRIEESCIGRIQRAPFIA
jgi:hypothetical protein